MILLSFSFWNSCGETIVVYEANFALFQWINNFKIILVFSFFSLSLSKQLKLHFDHNQAVAIQSLSVRDPSSVEINE